MTFLYHRDQGGWRFSEDGETAILLEAELEGSGILAPDRFPEELSVVGHVLRDRRYFVLHKPSGRREMRGAELTTAEYENDYDYDPYAAAAQLLGFRLSEIAAKLEGSGPRTTESNRYLAHAQRLFLELSPAERGRDYLSVLPERGPLEKYPHTRFVFAADDTDSVRTIQEGTPGAARVGSTSSEGEAPGMGMRSDEWRRYGSRLRAQIDNLGRDREALGQQVADLTDAIAVRRQDAAELGGEVVALEERLSDARREAAALEQRIVDARREPAAHDAALARTSGDRERDERPVKEETQASYESEIALLNERVSALQETFERSRGETLRGSFRQKTLRLSWPAAVAILSLAALAVALTGNQELDEAAATATAAAGRADTAASEATAAAGRADTAASEATAAAGRADTAASEATAAAGRADTAASEATAAAGRADTAASEATAAAGSRLEGAEIADTDEDDADTDEEGTTSR